MFSWIPHDTPLLRFLSSHIFLTVCLIFSYDIRHRCNPGCNSLQFFTKFKVDMFRGRIPGLKWYTLYWVVYWLTYRWSPTEAVIILFFLSLSLAILSPLLLLVLLFSLPSCVLWCVSLESRHPRIIYIQGWLSCSWTTIIAVLTTLK